MIENAEFIVSQYLIYSISDKETVLQTHDCITFINRPNMVKFLRLIENSLKVSSQEIEKFFGDSSDSATEFLLEQGVLTRDSELNFEVTKIYFVYNGVVDTRFVPSTIENISIEIVVYDQFLKNNFVENGTLIILLLNEYNTKLVENISKMIAKIPNVYLLTTFYFKFKYYMDNLYSELWSVPNHNDRIGLLRMEKSLEDDKLSYIKLIDAILERDRNFCNGIVLSEVQQLFLINSIFSRVTEIFDRYSPMYLSDYNLLETYEIDPINHKISRDIATFWELLN